jgi:hypothetical protein
MSKAVYRGVAYDTDVAKQEYKAWYNQTHSPSHPTNTYRGVDYHPCKKCGGIKMNTLFVLYLKQKARKEKLLHIAQLNMAKQPQD